MARLLMASNASKGSNASRKSNGRKSLYGRVWKSMEEYGRIRESNGPQWTLVESLYMEMFENRTVSISPSEFSISRLLS